MPNEIYGINILYIIVGLVIFFGFLLRPIIKIAGIFMIILGILAFINTRDYLIPGAVILLGIVMLVGPFK